MANDLAKALDQLVPGYLPADVFYAVSRLSVLTAAEVVPLRKRGDGGYEVLLTRRPDDDPYFAGLLHIPGQIYRPGDTINSRPAAVVADELANTTTLSTPVLIPGQFIYDYGRGPVVERIHYVFVSDSSDGDFYDVDSLPSDLLAGHDELIKRVVRYVKGETMTIYLGADHQGFALKNQIGQYLQAAGYQVIDCGNREYDPSDDFPVYAVKAAKQVAASDGGARAILVCGGGQGMCMAANRIEGVRAIVVTTADEARYGRHDNDANVLCLPARDVSDDDAWRPVVETFLNTPFAGAERYRRRNRMLDEIRGDETVSSSDDGENNG